MWQQGIYLQAQHHRIARMHGSMPVQNFMSGGLDQTRMDAGIGKNEMNCYFDICSGGRRMTALDCRALQPLGE